MIDDEIHEIAPYRDGVVATVNMDKWSKEDQEEFCIAAAETTDRPLFADDIEHADSLSFVSTEDQCPRCNAETQEQYGNFIYATQIAPRVMFAPAGFFCTKCPTVIIDEQMVEDGITDERFDFLGVLGIDYGTKKAPDFFRTWNGEQSVYIFDEHKTPIGISTHSLLADGRRPAVKKHKTNRRNKMAKLSRKRNRRR